jgi:hypothetical protein
MVAIGVVLGYNQFLHLGPTNRSLASEFGLSSANQIILITPRSVKWLRK